MVVSEDQLLWNIQNPTKLIRAMEIVRDVWKMVWNNYNKREDRLSVAILQTFAIMVFRAKTIKNGSNS